MKQSQGMNAGFQANVGQKQRVGSGQIAKTRELECQLASSELEPEVEEAGLDQGELEDDTVEDGPETEDGDVSLSELPKESISGEDADLHETVVVDEPPEREDDGDSEGWFLTDARNPFEQNTPGLLPLISELPRAARPIVRFAIDEDYCVHPLDLSDDPFFDARRSIALAVAMHLKQRAVQLKSPGDWCEIPAIGSDDDLIRLIATALDEDSEKVGELVRLRKALRKKNSQTKADDKAAIVRLLDTLSWEFRDIYEKLQKRGANFKSLGLQLPNGDVVQVSALMDVARLGKQATRAAALRLANNAPSCIAGEKWDAAEWKGFIESQRKKKYKPKNKQSGPQK